MAHKVFNKYRAPKYTEFSRKDLVVDIKEGRLSLVIFVNEIMKNNTQLKFPVPEMKRTT